MNIHFVTRSAVFQSQAATVMSVLWEVLTCTVNGQFSERYGVLTPFQHHFNLHVSQNFIYNKKNKARVQISLDIVNIGNMINREWGIYTASLYSLTPLRITVIAVDNVALDVAVVADAAAAAGEASVCP